MEVKNGIEVIRQIRWLYHHHGQKVHVTAGVVLGIVVHYSHVHGIYDRRSRLIVYKTPDKVSHDVIQQKIQLRVLQSAAQLSCSKADGDFLHSPYNEVYAENDSVS